MAEPHIFDFDDCCPVACTPSEKGKEDPVSGWLDAAFVDYTVDQDFGCDDSCESYCPQGCVTTSEHQNLWLCYDENCQPHACDDEICGAVVCSDEHCAQDLCFDPACLSAGCFDFSDGCDTACDNPASFSGHNDHSFSDRQSEYLFTAPCSSHTTSPHFGQSSCLDHNSYISDHALPKELRSSKASQIYSDFVGISSTTTFESSPSSILRSPPSPETIPSIPSLKSSSKRDLSLRSSTFRSLRAAEPKTKVPHKTLPVHRSAERSPDSQKGYVCEWILNPAAEESLREVCNQTFESPSALDKHLNEAHIEHKKEFTCQWANCASLRGKPSHDFKHKGKLRRHVQGSHSRCKLDSLL